MSTLNLVYFQLKQLIKFEMKAKEVPGRFSDSLVLSKSQDNGCQTHSYNLLDN